MADSFWLAIAQGTTAFPKALAKLVDTVGDQVGLFLEPRHIRRKGTAETEVRIANAEADVKIRTIEMRGKQVIQDREERAKERLRKLEEQRQSNIENITRQAAESLPEDVTDTPVETDWVATFFMSCQDISNEQMQLLWAKLLAGEISKPGSFSLKTLAAVKMLTVRDATLFTHYCSAVWRAHGVCFPLYPQSGDSYSDNSLRVKFADFNLLNSSSLGSERGWR